MSRILSVSCMLLFFFLLLFFPSAAADGASAGILLWYRKILPVLLPFTLASRLMEASNIISFLPPAVGMAVLGWCCGYPMGAIWAAILVRNGKLTCRQGELLLPLCSQPSPMFLVGYLRTQAGGLEPASTPCGSISSTALDSSPTALHLWKRKQRKNRENSWRSSYPPNP